MHLDSIPVAEYEKLVSQFNPVKFNADEWVSIAADAGQKYMVITSRHHDGFSMYDTALSEYKVTNSPFKRDPIRNWPMPVPGAVMSNSAFIARCSIGIILPTVSAKRAGWPGRIMWLFAWSGARTVYQFRRNRLYLV